MVYPELPAELRSIKYPVANALVATREPTEVDVKAIKDLKLNPGPHDGYDGAGHLPLVSARIADLLQTKPSAFCGRDERAGDRYWLSYDERFPSALLWRLCEGQISDQEIEENLGRLEARGIISLYYAYD